MPTESRPELPIGVCTEFRKEDKVTKLTNPATAMAASDPGRKKAVPQIRRQARIVRIARALMSGATITEIAEGEGISRSAASRDANSPECRQFLTELVDSERDEMHALFFLALRVIRDACSARREYMTKDGERIVGGPDHYARLAATKHFRDLMTVGRPTPKQPEKQEKRRLTLPEFEELVRESEQARLAA